MMCYKDRAWCKLSVCDFKTEECGYIGADQTGGQNELR